jgi:hypothetical protein
MKRMERHQMRNGTVQGAADAQNAKISALFSCFIWGIIALKSLIGYKASSVIESLKIQSYAKKGFVLLGLIAVATLFKFRHEFKTSAKNRQETHSAPRGRNLFSLQKVAKIGESALKSDW